MITRFLGILNFLMKKVRYIFNKNIIFPKKGNFPISLELKISPKSHFYLGKNVLFLEIYR